MPRSIKRLGRFPAAIAKVKQVEPGAGPDSNIDGYVTAKGVGKIHKEDMDLARGYTDIPGVYQPEKYPILYVFITGENIEEARGGGMEVDREEIRKVASGGENNNI